jgi:hypothetical protein
MVINMANVPSSRDGPLLLSSKPNGHGSYPTPKSNGVHSSPTTSIHSLSAELIRLILDHLDSDKLVNLDKRAYLSQESFRAPPDFSASVESGVGNFRLTCRRFSELGALVRMPQADFVSRYDSGLIFHSLIKHQFARVRTKFSRKGLARLENIARREHLARNVRKFTYLVPSFYEISTTNGVSFHCKHTLNQGTGGSRDRIQRVLPIMIQRLGSFDMEALEGKVEDQKYILDTNEDGRVLEIALKAFRNLQHVQVLPLQDHQDERLSAYFRFHHEVEPFVELSWPDACFHSTKTVGEALLKCRSPCTRWSSPMLNPRSAAFLGREPPGLNSGIVDSLDTLASRLTCLELHFDDGFAPMNDQIREMSPLFRKVFASATNLEAVHVGFPSSRPLSLGLEEIFHHMKWDKLKAFGIQGWKLSGEEIMELALRQREKLVGLRLREVLLKEGSKWKDVLYFLRTRMPQLDWISLRRIDYAKAFDDRQAAGGVEISDDLDLDSDEDDDDYSVHTIDSDQEMETSSIGSESHDGDAGAEDDPIEGSRMEFPDFNNPQRHASMCICEGSGTRENDDPEDLEDNGEFVSHAKIKIWEKWVVRKCPIHD